MLFTNTNKYHLPHNSIRIDEFNHMLNSIDLNEEFYIYEDLRALFLKAQINDNKFQIFHEKIHKNLLSHKDLEIRRLYNETIRNPNNENILRLMDCQYTKKKTFKKIFNETVRDYTEFFAFLGLLPTYYKFKNSGEKKHFVSQLLKDYIHNKITFEEIMLNFKYRNASKNYNSIDMYQLELRPFVVALKALEKYFEKGFEKINSRIISAITIYSKNENIDEMLEIFDDPQEPIKAYKELFDEDYKKINNELYRATLFLKPYLLEMGYVTYKKQYYFRGDKPFSDLIYPQKAVFCNSTIGNMDLTPVVGRILYTLYIYSKEKKRIISKSDLFDPHVSSKDIEFLIEELQSLGCINKQTDGNLFVSEIKNQFAINPYSDFLDIIDADYVRNIKERTIIDERFIIDQKYDELNKILEELQPIALGSNGEKYEENLYSLLKEKFDLFKVDWLGSNTVGKRISDIFMKVDIFDGFKNKKIGIIIECKSGNAVKSFDERKEIDDVINTLSLYNETFDGIWYWVVNGDSLPKINEHGGYRKSDLSKSFMEKLHKVHFNVSEFMRAPTIVTAFSFDAFSTYLKYLYPLMEKMKYNNINIINSRDIPHFWVWSKKFMNMQYVMVHKELEFIE